MGMYRKKPVVIEARQLDKNNACEIALWCGEGLPPMAQSRAWVNPFHPYSLTIHTLEGDMLAFDGDWIIKGINGEFYPCKPDIFEKTYETVKEGK